MNDKIIKPVAELSWLEMCIIFRHGPDDSPYKHPPLAKEFNARFLGFGGMTPKLSKLVGTKKVAK